MIGPPNLPDQPCLYGHSDWRVRHREWGWSWRCRACGRAYDATRARPSMAGKRLTPDHLRKTRPWWMVEESLEHWELMYSSRDRIIEHVAEDLGMNPDSVLRAMERHGRA